MIGYSSFIKFCLLLVCLLDISESFIDNIYRSFYIHSSTIYLLIGAFNPFTFKVIIDIYVPIAIFLIVWGWFCRSFFSLVFLDYIGPFKFCFKADLVVLNSLNFCLSCLCLICRLDFLARSYVYARADLVLSVAICLEYWACFLDSPDVEDFWVVSLTLWMWCHGGMYCVLLLHWTWVRLKEP